MSKSPAFLFYTNDFYEGTRLMLPEERACCIDLLIYQHQHGIIPNNLKKMQMYCSGVCEATLKATLEAKFKLTPEGWYNERLKEVMTGRDEYITKQSKNGIVGQFWKKSRVMLSADDYTRLRKELKSLSNNEIYDQIRDKKITKAMLEAMLKHLENENVNENVIVNEKEKGVQGKKENIPTLDEFLAYANLTLQGKFRNYEFSLRTKYQAWKESGWVDGNGNPIINWKSKLLNTLPHLKEIETEKYEPPPIPIFKRG